MRRSGRYASKLKSVEDSGKISISVVCRKLKNVSLYETGAKIQPASIGEEVIGAEGLKDLQNTATNEIDVGSGEVVEKKEVGVKTGRDASESILPARTSKGKRKLNEVIDLSMVELQVEHGKEGRFLNLRSGSRIPKRIDEIQVDLREEEMREAWVESERNMSERMLTARRAKGKRKTDMVAASGTELPVGDGGFLSLRSGSRIPKRRMRGVDAGMNKDDDEIKSKVSMGKLSNGHEETVSVEKGLSAEERASVNCRRRFSQQEKGKALLNGFNSGNLVSKLKADKLTEVGISNSIYHPDKIEIKDEEGQVKGRRRFSREEKGKGKLTKVEDLPKEVPKLNSIENAVSNTNSVPEKVIQGKSQISIADKRGNPSRRSEYKERFLRIARENASRFAHFAPQEEEEDHIDFVDEGEIPSRETEGEIEDWPGPFSTAMKIIKDRATNLPVQKDNVFSNEPQTLPTIWVPKKDHNVDSLKPMPPSLLDLCTKILVKNAEAISSLEGVPDVLLHKLSQWLCDSRKMNNHFFDLLTRGCPTDISVRDCSWLTEEQFLKSFEGCDTENLMVLQLDLCGRFMADYILCSTLARSPNILPSLTTISLRGACRLSDVGLSALLSSAPALKSINLGQCSLLTSNAINSIADSLGSILKELYLDDCEGISNAMLILPALKKLESLEVLSLAGLQSVCDDFIMELIPVCGHNMKEIVLTDCVLLTDSSIKVVAESCPGLCALEIVNLSKLTDTAIGYLANGCRVIQTLKLCRNAFSDEAVAAFLEASGESLKELSLNNVKKVGYNTAISLARRGRNLFSLDVSWCRNLTDEMLGLIVDSCLSLRALKLFGCTQVTKVFLKGHSNPHVQIIGLQLSPILEHLSMPYPRRGREHYSSASSSV